MAFSIMDLSMALITLVGPYYGLKCSGLIMILITTDLIMVLITLDLIMSFNAEDFIMYDFSYFRPSTTSSKMTLSWP
jgi:hypothetical protein